MAQARRWKMSSVASLKNNKISRQCLWALAMRSSKNTKFTKRTWLRIWDYFETGLSWILNYVKNRASAQSDWAFGASSYRFQQSLTHDVLFSVIQSVSEHSGLAAAKAAIGNWIVAYALSKVVVVQSVIRRWLVCKGNRDSSCHFSEIQHNHAESIVVDQDDAISVLTAAEVVSAVSRINYCSREFRAGVTFSVVCNSAELKWSGEEQSWRSLITVFDTAAMINMIAESVVDSNWSYVEGNRESWSSVTSVDGVKISVGGKVIVPGHSMVFNGRVMPLVATVVKSIPNQVELLIGLPVILSPDYRLLPDLSSWRVYDRVAKETIRLDLVHRIVSRRSLGPINMLSLCAGMCIEVAVMIELGFEVAFVHVVETSPVTQVIAAASFPMVRLSKSGDVNDNIACDQTCRFFAGFAGPQCIHWSRLRDNPGGYGEPGSSTFTSSALRLNAERKRCGMNFCLETVQVHENLRCDMFRQEQECGVPAQELNANAVGGVAGRNRRYFVPGVDLSKIERFRHVSPDLAADSGWQFRDKPVPAPVARGSSTKSPIVMIRAYGNFNPRFCNSDERDRVNPGLASGISCGYHRTTRLISPEIRDRAKEERSHSCC